MARLVQRATLPQGDAQFEANRQAIVQSVLNKIPQDLILPDKYIDDPPLDVTGVPRECGLLTAEELDITENYDFIALAEAIASKKFTSFQVTSALCRRACIAHQLTFCLTELYMEEALQQAKDLDEYLASNGKPIGPLHGVPVSIKEMIPVKGQLTSFGLVVTRTITEKDCVLVDILRQQGAVFYVKTHQPAAVFSLESTSFLGRTLNPHNIDLSSGGSSGGEGALLAMKGSVLGFGTDIGGSIRVPAAFCGIHGFKGSHGFHPSEGMLLGPLPAGISVDIVIGPMGRSLQDIDFINRVIRSSNPWLRDPEVFLGPYTGLSSGIKDKTNLRIGLMRDYSLVQPYPPQVQELNWVEQQLKDGGFNVSPFKFFEAERAHVLFCKLMLADGFKTVRKAFAAGNEPKYPRFEKIAGDIIAAAGAEDGKDEGGMAVVNNRWERDVYRSEFLADWIQQGDPDIVVAPMHPAFPHDTSDILANVSQTHLWNVVDYPCLVVPTPFKMEDKASYDSEVYENGEPWSEADAKAKAAWKEHDFQGAPICFQIVARRRMENELFEAVGLIKDALQLK